MSLITYDAENGSDGTNLTTANVPAAAVSVGSNSSLIFSTAAASAGNLGYAVSAATSEAALMRLTPAATNMTMASAFDFRVATSGSPGNRNIVYYRGSGYIFAVQYSSTTHKLSWTDAGATLTTMSETLNEGTWYRLEVRLIVASATTGSWTINVYPATSTTAINATPYVSTSANLATAAITSGDFGGIAGGSGMLLVSLDNIRFNDGSTSEIGPYAASNAPTADAGSNQTAVQPWSLVSLDGSASMAISPATITSYSWSPPAGVTLSSTSAASPTFSAPPALSDQTYTLNLTVTDSNGVVSAASSVSVMVLAATEAWLNPSGTWRPARLTLL